MVFSLPSGRRIMHDQYFPTCRWNKSDHVPVWSLQLLRKIIVLKILMTYKLFQTTYEMDTHHHHEIGPSCSNTSQSTNLVLQIISYNSSKFTTFRHSVVATPMDVMVKGNRRIPIKFPLWAFVCSRFRFQTSVDLLFEFISAYGGQKYKYFNGIYVVSTKCNLEKNNTECMYF